MSDLQRHRFWALVHAAQNSTKDARLITLAHNEARISLGRSHVLVVLLDEQPYEKVGLLRWLEILLASMRVRELDVLVLSSGDEVRKTLTEAEFQTPWSMRLSLSYLSEEGHLHDLTQGEEAKTIRGLVAGLTQADLTDDAVASYKRDIKRNFDQDRSQFHELSGFARRLQMGHSLSTWVLLVSVLLMFFLEEWLGGATYAPVLVRLGANSRALIEQGQVYRLVTSMFLHGGLLHIAANGYVLYILGSFFNRLLGETRFLIVYFISGIMGSLSSMYIGKGALSVGASGALWGLFGVAFALSLVRSDFLPDLVRERMKRMVLINLVINLGISLLPMVDLWAHFGGGIAGFLVGLVFAYQGRELKFPKLALGLASCLVALAPLSIVLDFASQDPFALKSPFVLQQKQIAGSSFSLGIPTLCVGSQTRQIAGQTVSSFGRYELDPFVVRAMVTPAVELSQAHLAERMVQEMHALKGKLLLGPITADADGHLLVMLQYLLENGLVVWAASELRDDQIVDMRIEFFQDTPQSLIDQMQGIFLSVKPSIAA